jgi:hypothetical protein
VRGLDRGDPVTQRLVDRILQRSAPRLDGHDLGPEQLHPEDVEGLTLDIDRTHEDDAVEAEERRRGGRRDSVLAGSRLRDHTLLPHPLGQQRLTKHVVDLVRAGMGEVLALQQDAQPEAFGEAMTFGHRCRPTCIVGEQRRELGAKPLRRPGGSKLALELFERGHEGLRDEAPSELAEATEAGRLRTRAPEDDR